MLQLPTPISYKRSGSASSSHSSHFLLSNVPHSKQPSASIFGISQEHPFANYWTTQGGIPEVVGVLPSKEHADLLVSKYFEAVDPVYPMLDRQRFYADYERFWALPLQEKQRVDAAMLALHFAVYAMGAQFIQMDSEQQKAQIAEFYVSAAHQSLRLYLFLSRTSLKSIQAMILMAYFLMNDNKAADAWAFGGILLRQAYAMGLNRDPDLIVPHVSAAEKQSRRKLWQAVYFQDTFLTVLLKLPPTATFADVTVDSLTDDPIPDPQAPTLPTDSPAPNTCTNPMSISAIAPPQIASPVQPPLSVTSVLPPPPSSAMSTANDVAFIRSMWQLADLVQRNVCFPRALSRPLTTSPRNKANLLSQFHALYASFPPALTCITPGSFAALLATDTRVARQNLFLRSNFWHCVMLIEADENEAGGVKCDVHGALKAGRLALGSFFDFWEGLRVDTGVWWVFQHRAFEEAVSVVFFFYFLSSLGFALQPGCGSTLRFSLFPYVILRNCLSLVWIGLLTVIQLTMASLLASFSPVPSSPIDGDSVSKVEPLFLEAKDDVRRALDILEHVASSAPEMQKTRTEFLRSAFEDIRFRGIM